MDLSRVNLNLLVSLDALLRTRNVTHAARELGLTQPAVSGALSRLRKMFDDPLLIRVGRTFELSPKALELQDAVAEILGLVQRTFELRTTFDPESHERTFHVSASDYAAVTLLGRANSLLADSAPGISMHVAPRTADAAGLVRHSSIDIVIEPAELMHDEALPSKFLFRDDWTCAVWQGNSHVGGVMTMEKYLELSHVVYAVGEGRRLAIGDQYLADIGITRRVEFVVESFLLAPFLLAGTDLVSLIPTRIASMPGLFDNLRLLKPPVSLPGLTERMWWNPRYTDDPAHAWFREVIIAAARSL